MGEMAGFLSKIKVSNTYLEDDFKIDLLKVSVLMKKYNEFLNLNISTLFYLKLYYQRE